MAANMTVETKAIETASEDIYKRGEKMGTRKEMWDDEYNGV